MIVQSSEDRIVVADRAYRLEEIAHVFLAEEPRRSR